MLGAPSDSLVSNGCPGDVAAGHRAEADQWPGTPGGDTVLR
jgi:hypothetical protein